MGPTAADSPELGRIRQELAEIKAIQWELFGQLHRLSLAALSTWQDQVRFADPRYRDPRSLAAVPGQVYSQNNEDGILAEIFRRIGITTRRFVEFGVGDGRENNSRLLLELGWSGHWVDADPASVAKIRAQFAEPIAAGRLHVTESLVTRENAASLVPRAPDDGDLDVLSLDIDYNTSHVWPALAGWRPRVCCIEYNSHYPAAVAYEVPYEPNRSWAGDSCFGASLKRLEQIGTDLGYALVGCDLMGVNAFFVRTDLVSETLFQAPFTAEQHHEPPRFPLVHPRGHSRIVPK
jgi:hypothetical protein